jgi:nucleoside-diphosphate-sugar epimerase
MKVLLTGANGFVGSHILDSLSARSIATAVLLRASSDRRFLAAHLRQVEVRVGDLSDPPSLRAALHDITHVVHCAGCTKALRVEDFYEINQRGTRNIVEAINLQTPEIERLILISSLAAQGPAPAEQPARESDPPHPVSDYGKSKLAAEREVESACRSDYVILRPSAVYGPRDTAFLALFKAVRGHLLPLIGGGRMALSFVFVKDLAEAVAASLTAPAAARKTFLVASPEIATSRQLGEEIAAQMKSWTLPLPLPTAALWPLCVLQDLASRLTGKANVLSRQKYPELTATGWVCDPGRLREELNFVCGTGLPSGVAETLAWYRREGWL